MSEDRSSKSEISLFSVIGFLSSVFSPIAHHERSLSSFTHYEISGFCNCLVFFL